MKLYSVSDGPPSLACQQLLKALDIKYELINVDFGKGEFLTKEYEELNPQKEIPTLVDDDLIMGESYADAIHPLKDKDTYLYCRLFIAFFDFYTPTQKIKEPFFPYEKSNAILQYLADQYDTNGKLYPKEPKLRAIVNHRLCFNLAVYYRNISEYVMAPIYYDYQRTPLGLKKMKIALDIFNTYLQRENSTYAAGNNLSIADFPLITATMCLEAIDFKLDAWPYVEKWYKNFKHEHPDLWEVAVDGMREISYFEKHPPDFNADHPIHPVRKSA